MTNCASCLNMLILGSKIQGNFSKNGWISWTSKAFLAIKFSNVLIVWIRPVASLYISRASMYSHSLNSSIIFPDSKESTFSKSLAKVLNDSNWKESFTNLTNSACFCVGMPSELRIESVSFLASFPSCLGKDFCQSSILMLAISETSLTCFSFLFFLWSL